MHVALQGILIKITASKLIRFSYLAWMLFVFSP